MIYNTKLNTVKNISDLYNLTRRLGYYSFYVRLSHSYGNANIDVNDYTKDTSYFAVAKHKILTRIGYEYMGGIIDTTGDNYFNRIIIAICKENNELKYYDFISCLTKIIKYINLEYGKGVIVISEKEFYKNDYKENRNYIINLLTKIIGDKNIDVLLLEDNITLPLLEDTDKKKAELHQVEWGVDNIIHFAVPNRFAQQAGVDGQVVVNMDELAVNRNIEENNEQELVEEHNDNDDWDDD